MNETMPIPHEWLKDLLDHDATPGEFLSPDDVMLEEGDGDAEGPPSKRTRVAHGGHRGDQ